MKNLLCFKFLFDEFVTVHKSQGCKLTGLCDSNVIITGTNVLKTSRKIPFWFWCNCRYRSKYFDIVAEAIRQEVSVLHGEEKFYKVFLKKWCLNMSNNFVYVIIKEYVYKLKWKHQHLLFGNVISMTDFKNFRYSSCTFRLHLPVASLALWILPHQLQSVPSISQLITKQSVQCYAITGVVFTCWIAYSKGFW